MFDLTFWQAAAITFIYFHIAGTTYTIYVHRSLMHRSVNYHPILARIFQIISWMTTGAWSKTVLGAHLVHHKNSDQPMVDLGSPYTLGKREVLFVKPLRAFFKHILFKRVIPIFKDQYLPTEAEKADPKTRQLIEESNRLMGDRPLDWEWFSNHTRLGPAIFLIVNLILFGWVGFVITALIQFSVVISLITVSDGILHLYGYRNFKTKDQSRNFSPWGIIFSGEELHNNHHAQSWRANFAYKPWEFDIGYFYIRIFKFFNLAETK